MQELKVIDSALFKYFMNLENEKQKDVAMIQKLLNRVAELEKQKGVNHDTQY